jgi:hypothetical protein
MRRSVVATLSLAAVLAVSSNGAGEAAASGLVEGPFHPVRVRVGAAANPGTAQSPTDGAELVTPPVGGHCSG